MSHHILIVEDEPVLQDLLQELLEVEGYVVEVAGDGVAALEQITQNRPALVILDLLLPRMDGAEVATRLRAQDWALPILVPSAATRAGDLVHPLGASAFMAKPFDMDAL